MKSTCRLLNKWGWEFWTHMQKSAIRPLFMPHTQINSQCIQISHKRPKMLKLLGEDTGGKLHGTGFGNFF